jgi:hypothetical protein
MEDGGEVRDLIYHEDRYFKNMSPLCTYIPSKEFLFKMMRACVGCENAE